MRPLTVLLTSLGLLACTSGGAQESASTGTPGTTTATTGTDTAAQTGETSSAGETSQTTEETPETAETPGVDPSAGAVLIGGGTAICTSAAPANCSPGATFPQSTALPLLTAEGPMYRLDAERLDQLADRPELSPTILDGLAAIPTDVDLTYDELLDQLDLQIGLELVPRGSVERAVILGYTVERHEEVVDLHSSASSAPRLFEQIVDLAAQADRSPRIGVITAASGDGRDAFRFYEQVFLQAGADEVRWIPVDLAYRQAVEGGCDGLIAAIEATSLEFDTLRRYPELSAEQAAACADPEALAATLSGLSGFFFSGGDQLRHKGALVVDGADSPELAAIRARVGEGAAVYAGTSAGTAVVTGPPMLARGESYNALVWGVKDEPCDVPGFELCVDDLVRDAEGGLDLFGLGLTDSHFSARGRVARAIRLAAEGDVDWIYGVDEGTALIVEPSDGASPPSLRVLGDRGVQIVDLRGAEAGGDPWALSGGRLHYLTGGDSFAPESAEVTFAADKSDLKGDETYDEAAPPSDDLFSSPNNSEGGGRANPREFVRISQDLCDSKVGSTYGRSFEGPHLGAEYPLRYRADLVKGAETRCYDGPLAGDVAYASMSITLAAEG